MSAVISLRDRLLAVDWEFGIDDVREETEARVALFREFLRRMAPYAAMGPSGTGLWPWIDAAARVDPAVRAPESVLVEVAEKVPEYPVTAVRTSCLLAVHFAALHDAGKVPDRQADPFAPLVRMFELGGAFSRDGSGMIEIGVAAVSVETSSAWLHKPLPDKLPSFPDLDGSWPDLHAQ